MAFPVLGQPLPQYHSQGEPMDGAYLEFRDPTTNALKVTYPTADDADVASGNENATTISLDARGEPEEQIWGVDGEEYKVTLFNAAGASVWVVTDVGWDVSNVTSTAVRIPLTTAESSASIAEYASGNSAGDITVPSREPGDPRRYGFGGTASDNVAAFQAAINQALYEYADTGRIIKLPSGQYDLNGPVYGQYHASNTNAPSDDRSRGRITIQGNGAGDFKNAAYGEVRGTVLNFTATTADQFLVSEYKTPATPSGINTKGLVLRDFAVWGATTGTLVSGRGAHYHDWQNITIYNDATGTALDLTDGHVWGHFRNIQLTGDGTGTGVKVGPEGTISGGSNCTFDKLSIDAHKNPETVSFDLGLDMGNAYLVTDTKYAKNITFNQCSFQDCVNAVRIRHGIANVTFNDCNWEGNGVGDATAVSIEISNSAGFSDEAGEELSGISFIDCLFADSDNTDGRLDIQLGDTGNGDDEDSHGPINFVRCHWAGTPTNVPSIYKYNNAYDEQVLIDGAALNLSGNGFFIVYHSDAAQYGGIKLLNTSNMKEVPLARWTVNASDADIKGRWLANGSDYVADWIDTNGGSPDYNYTNAPSLPSKIFTNVGQPDTQTVQLPDNTNVFQHDSVIQSRNTGATGWTCTLDAGTGNTITLIKPATARTPAQTLDLDYANRAAVRLVSYAQGEWYAYEAD